MAGGVRQGALCSGIAGLGEIRYGRQGELSRV